MDTCQIRWIVRGDFVAISQISIQTGAAEDLWPQEAVHPANFLNDLVAIPAKDKGKVPPSDLPPVQAIEIDGAGNPFLPASAIKGLLRSVLATTVSSKEQEIQLFRLFGDLPKAKDGTGKESAQGGLIEFRNAVIPEDEPAALRTTVRGKTKISEGSRTADDSQLHHDRVVVPKTKFRAEFVLTNADQNDLDLFLGLLKLIDGKSSYSAVGSSTSHGDGRLEWTKNPEIRKFGKAEAAKWLVDVGNTSWTDFAVAISATPTDLQVDSGAVLEIPLTIQIDGHFLVSAWGRQGSGAEEGPIRRPYRLSNDDENALLPGSSLDGALRAQAKRIFRTMSGDATPWTNEKVPPKAFEDLFGSSKQTSLLEVDSFETEESHSIVRQDFVAIDRFSGGQTDGKKFALEAFEQPALKGQLRLYLSRKVNPELTGKSGVKTERTLTLEAIGLLALVLKDLATGDIPLGHATRKGYGGVRSIDSGGQDWTAMLRALGEGVIPAFPQLSGMIAESALQHCVTLLQEQAATRTPTGGTE